jgi:hypothetical protein
MLTRQSGRRLFHEPLRRKQREHVVRSTLGERRAGVAEEPRREMIAREPPGAE